MIQIHKLLVLNNIVKEKYACNIILVKLNLVWFKRDVGETGRNLRFLPLFYFFFVHLHNSVRSSILLYFW